MRLSRWGPGCGCLHRTGQLWPRAGGTQREGKTGFAGRGEALAKPPSTCTDRGRIPASPATRTKCLWLKPPVLRWSGLDTHRAPQSQSGSWEMLGTDCKTLHPLSGVTGLSSQAAQWSRICQPMQETQETRVQSLGQEEPLE